MLATVAVDPAVQQRFKVAVVYEKLTQKDVAEYLFSRFANDSEYRESMIIDSGLKKSSGRKGEQ